MRALATLLILFLSLNYTAAQQVVIRDAEDRSALPRASVSNDKGITIFTTKNGVFELDTFRNDAVLHISYLGYERKEKAISAINKKDLTIYLKPSSLFLEMATVNPKGSAVLENPTQQIEVLTAREIQFSSPMNTAMMLENSGVVSVQRSQLGGGSPQMRGFEANKVLLIIDGVRMNNAIYRSGHVQNAITVDANILDRTEVFFGPSSVLYGSDALGGAIHFKTKKPILAEEFNQNITRVNILGRVASASEERTFHADVMYGAKKWGLLTSITHAQFGDLRMGANRPHGDSQWGLVPFYVTQQEGTDVLRENADPNIQKYTGYSQTDFLQKITYRASKNAEINVNFQYSNSSDVPRFDRLNDPEGDGLKWAEWYYGPQRRLLTSANLRLKNQKLFDEADITVAYQRIDEDRADRRFGRTSKFYNFEDVQVYSLNADFNLERSKKVMLYYGAEITHNDVRSSAFEENTITGERSNAITRYPNGGSSYSTAAIYASQHRKLKDNLDLNIGLRYNHTIANSRVVPTEFYTLPYDEITINDGALTASLGVNYRPTKTWEVKAGISTGFKSPNVDDYGKIFEKDGFVIIPNSDLKSEYIYSSDLTIQKSLLDKKLHVSATPYFTYLTNAIVRRDTTLNGSTEFLFEGDLATVQTNKNAAQAVVYGLSAKVRYKLNSHFISSATYNYTYGQELTTEVPMSHIPPEFGKINVEYYKDRFTAEAYFMYAFQKEAERYGPGTTDNLVEALPEGNPSWHTFNLRTSTQLSKTVILQFTVENILDRHYKVFASGLSSPGRNFILSLKTVF